jgi:hypothetical protein
MLKILSKGYLYLALIIVVAFIVRYYRIDSPIADWHSWRQADTAAVTRNFVKYGFDPLIPKYDDMSGVSEYPVANPNRFRFVEFPIYNIVTYPLYMFFGVEDMYSRLVSVLFSLGSIIFLYLISKRYLGEIVSLIIALFYSLLPFNIFFSRTTLPEPTFLFFALGMMYFVEKKIWDGKRFDGLAAFIFTTIAFLIKPWAIFFVPPLIYSFIIKNRKFNNSYLKFILFALLAITPFLIWRLWILQQPEGIPASNWLMNGDHIRFRPAFWWWLISERFGREIFGATGLVLLTIGIIIRPKNGYFFHIWLLSAFAYLITFATGNVRHNYYQYITVPVFSVFFALGFIYLIKGINNFLPRVWTIVLALIFLPLSFYFTWTQVKGFYQINNPVIIEAGKKADQILPKDAIVVAPYNGDTAFLYQTNRAGWPVTALPLTEMVADYGVTHFISTTRDSKTNWVLRHFRILEDDPKFIIADLTKIQKPIGEDFEQ